MKYVPQRLLTQSSAEQKVIQADDAYRVMAASSPFTLLGIACFVYLLLVTWPLQAAEEKPLPPDVRLVIDVSGSMKQNDPNNLRRPAVDLLVKLLPDDSKSGVWTFGQYVNMLIPHREVSETWRSDASQKSNRINSTGLFTNIGQALEKAAYDSKNPNSNYKTSIILLTDGMVDISRESEENQAEWRRIVDEVLPRLKASGYTVHTIGLSDNADTELLNRLASATDGVASIATTAEELMKIFLRTFDSAAPAEQLPLEGNQFVVDSSVEEFTALIFRKPSSKDAILVSPENERYQYGGASPYVKWHKSDQYDLITVQKPLEGEWTIQAELEPDSRVTVVSNLNLVVKPLKNNIYVNDKLGLSLLLSEDGKTIKRKDFLELLDITSQVTRRNNPQEWQDILSKTVPPSSGIYTSTLDVFDQEDYYDIQVVVDGKSFKREFSHVVAVRKPFGVKVDKKTSGAETHYFVTVSSFGDDIDRDKTKVVARIKNPNNRTIVKPLTLTDVENWLLDFVPDIEGDYEIALTVTAVDSKGAEFEYAPGTVIFSYPDSDDPFSVKEAVEENDPLPADIESATPIIPSDPPAPRDQEPETPDAESDAKVDIDESESPIQMDEPQQEDSKLWLYVGLGLGNLLILVLAYFAYRMLMGNKAADEMEELDEIVAEVKKGEKPEEAKEAAPSMSGMAGLSDDLDGDSEDDAESDSNEEHKSSGSDMMAADLNIATEDDDEFSVEAENHPLDTAAAEEKEPEDLGVTDVEFSLDDFSSDDLLDDDDDEEEDKK